MVTSCNTTKPIIGTDTNSTHHETTKTDTTYAGKTIDVKVPGERKEAMGDSIRIQVRDSVVIRDSIIYRYRDLDSRDYKVNIPPTFAWGQYGYAKAYVDNNKLFVFYIAHDRVVQQYIDSCVQVIVRDRYINDSIRITNNLINGKAFSGGNDGDKPFLSTGMLVLLIVVITAVTLLLLRYGGSFIGRK